MRRTKIICTIGPASEKDEILREMIAGGMNVARLNFSHGNHQEHLVRIKKIRKIAEELGKNVAIMLDTKGPEIRTGELASSNVILHTGDNLILTTEPIVGNQDRLYVSYEKLPEEVSVKDQILLDDGLISLIVSKIEGKEIFCQIENGGKIKPRMGVNVPGEKLNLPFLSEKDKQDILFGIKNGIDFIALSFVRDKYEVEQVRALLDENESNIHIIAKIENIFAVENIKSIIKVSDGIMVARGDLGVEIPIEEIPIIQKKIIRYCFERATPVITATQMLDSMIRNPRPTRAEVTDVANAVLDGTDCVMLSGETAAGDYPLLTLKTMIKIVLEAENLMCNSPDRFKKRKYKSMHPITDNISESAVQIAHKLDATALIVPTRSGFTPRMVAKYRPSTPVYAMVSHKSSKRLMCIVWGVETVEIVEPDNIDSMIERATEACLKQGYIQEGDMVVITAGVPIGVSGKTNLLKVQIV
ncbi:pyruvate kinase [Clostridia bacterium]|nr:pyruvate kinase [Clostridia bacterium]